MSHPNKKRLRRSMMFLNCQKPGLIKDPYIYRPDSIMLDLEDAVAENQKDAARYSLFHALQEIDYHGVERVVRINGLDTPHWKEDIRVCVAGGADTIRIAKTETAQDVRTVEEHVLAAEREFGSARGQHSFNGGPGILQGRFKCPGGVPVLRPAHRHRPFRRRLHKGPSDHHHRHRRGAHGSQTAYDHGRPGRQASSAGIRCSPTWTTWRALKRRPV